MSKEKHTQKAILDYLRLQKVLIWKSNTTGIKKPDGHWIPSQNKGCPDLIGILPGGSGRMLAIEVKSGKGHASDLQLEFITKINQAGGVAFVARSIEDVMSVFRDVGVVRR